ncbi:endonuclease III domain-containing protein [Alicyclobacillus sp. ALC3]|uniref:endonuclease III domain-containing protein n=1 Tax=Alicyclobacillus sp. ALC3 TaxID=2796143 RepID=UPI002378DA53|nr:endonuclease [Alicyclobacillus sp. ALC3]WDL97065.1 endonuclease [Alicyclobacillus sp. ALC3]
MNAMEQHNLRSTAIFQGSIGPNQHKLHELSSQTITDHLLRVYQRMFDQIGPRYWWPADTGEEVVIGAILVQNVSWANTEKALHNLAEAELLSFSQLRQAELEEIEGCIRSTRFYRTKARKLKAFADHLAETHHNSLSVMLSQPLDKLRKELLNIYGIGPETADDILLYAAKLPSFVIDTYTKRIFHRLGLVPEDISYDELRGWFMEHLPQDVQLYNEYHALIDAVGHRFCNPTQPKCGECPLRVECVHLKNINRHHHDEET